MNIILKTIRRWRNESVSRGQLARLDDRMLRDIGIARADIEHVVRQAR
jgi:uncharacterized protein YjiS (DUF1127 family)